jgi:hypothetical protein
MADRYDGAIAAGSGSCVCQGTVREYPLPDYGPVDSVNCPVRTRMQGDMGRGSSKLPFARLTLAAHLVREVRYKAEPSCFSFSSTCDEKFVNS